MNTPLIIGRQTFDGLGRQLSVEAAGYITQFEYTQGQLPPTANVLANGKRVDFTYEPALSNKLLSVKPQDEAAQQLSYHPLGMPASASGALGTEAFDFTMAGQPQQDTWTVDGTPYNTLWLYSINGLLQGFRDANGENHRRHFDAQGRVQQTQVGNLTTRYIYDGLSRPVSIIIKDPDNSRTLTTAMTYDALGRESTRTFSTTAIGDPEQPVINTFTQTLAYSALDQIISRIWTEDDQLAEEAFEYDTRGRLVTYVANALAAPEDPFGNRIVRQEFSFNALNGHEKVVTTFTDESTDEALFTYAKGNPVQVVKITHTHPSWPQEVTLTYDACGRVVSDSLGRRMVWNAQDRLTEVHLDDRTCQYGYTAHGRLADRTLDGTLSRSFFSGEELTHERTGENSMKFCSGAQGMFAINKIAGGVHQTILLGADAQGSIKLEADSDIRTRRYSAHGAEPVSTEHVPFGFAGQRHEPLTGWQILGDYRPYDPVLMCFLSPDSLSPFGKGGLNPYAYCAGDPVNRIDPDGHSWVSYALAGIGLAIGIATAIASFGTASAVIGGIAAAGWSALTPSAAITIGAVALDITSTATGIAAMGMELAGADSNASDVLGWVSLGTGLAAAGALTIGFKTSRSALNMGRYTKSGSPSAPIRKMGHADVLFGSPRPDVAFHHNLWGDVPKPWGPGELRAFETHGLKNGHLMNANGVFEDAANIARQEIAPRLAGYASDRPLVLLACEGGRSGAAQQVADVVRRPVIGFDKVIHLHAPHLMTRFGYGAVGKVIETNFPLQRVSFWKQFKISRQLPYDMGRNYELATYKFYYPQ
ncbi:RHS repeat domain-containing protein [Pseudomonas sp. Pseu.R1]|uniref:RHS repeat domain-containing protein n=1 Tax=Pseudomonas sp. Pseu.R1 TaxID=3379818 RepID=UPI003B936A98